MCLVNCDCMPPLATIAFAFFVFFVPFVVCPAVFDYLTKGVRRCYRLP